MHYIRKMIYLDDVTFIQKFCQKRKVLIFLTRNMMVPVCTLSGIGHIL